MSLTRLPFEKRSRGPLIGLWTLIIIVSCLSMNTPAMADENAPETLVDEKYSLKADREALEKLRKDIPADVKKENDEKAFMDQMMSDLSRNPSEVRGKFSSLLNKKRTLFNKDMTKARETFTKAQKKERDEFSKDLGEQRKDASKKKMSSEERKDFFDDLEAKRKDFYANQKEKRDEFEANMRDKRKDFDDYARSKNDEFNQLHRDYSKRYEENKKLEKDRKKEAEEQRKQQTFNLDQEYEPVRKKAPKILAPNESEPSN
ncbi:hypothetical protein [Bdellovibrio reynosensis]|uniref:Uncharacterized protein n=1 Tax=Bdellovibrio reynosensis TaxID=2835041 RepID=A0ABY4C4H7_9BACT|nr:hypothetical protein [Bdellovibrio reynosensis]UOE99841.1 hypothetical protein MNR06_09045 [Bdellovibrio reynosensis]